MMSNARMEILSRIAKALSPRAEAPTPWAQIPRDYRRSSEAPQSYLIALLTRRLHDYDAHVLACDAAGLTDSIRTRLSARGLHKLLLPNGFNAAVLPDGFTYLQDSGLTFAGMDQCDGVITESTLAIAETGTVVLQNVPGQGRRAASLIPDYHLCIVQASRILATVPEAIEALTATSTLPTTFISGPSATADIEMTRVKGVHGPRSLDIILVTDR
jgi:L-lactate dehydrogenase complex protein LldG